MNLFGALGIELKVQRKNPQDSVLITVKKPNGQIRTAVVKPGTDRIESSPNYLVQAPIKDKQILLKKTFRFISAIGYLVVGILFVSLLVARITEFGEARVVLTGSMAPAINPGDMVFTVNDNFTQPKINDVVIYEARTFEGDLVAPFAHRIIGGDAEKGWIMKGDANEKPDLQQPKSADITGVVKLVVPKVGILFDIKALIFLVAIIISIHLTREILRTPSE